MAYLQHGLSRTLPKNFTFPSVSGAEPKTPEHASIYMNTPPPPPRHSSCRLRRMRPRSGTDVFAQAEYDLSTFKSDIPLPSIELPSSVHMPVAPPYSLMPASDDRYLAPPRGRLDLKTPPAQIRGNPMDSENIGAWLSWDNQTLENSIERPGSACSHASDSSVSSIETFASRCSVGGSCTSTESDTYDPFFHLEIPPKEIAELPPQPAGKSKMTRMNKRRVLPKKERWTLDMDNHLWNTYQLYIQDPTITPFKMTPGSIPPLGVTHRVAREAKKTWERKQYRIAKQSPFASIQSRSGDTTPTPKADNAKPVWPKSEASTRRRLKLLCKRKFSIAPHYQRLMQSRSPTPALDLFSNPSSASSRFEGPDSSSMAYATRDLGVSLVASSVPGPLSQLAMESSSPQGENYELFNQAAPCHPQPHTVEPAAKKEFHLNSTEMIPRLGSPFTYHTWGPDTARRQFDGHRTRSRRDTIHVTGSRLRSPPRMDALLYIDNTNLAQDQSRGTEISSENETQRLERLLRQGKVNDIGHRRVRIRNRGATVSAVNARSLDQLFSPPSSASRNEEIKPVEKPVPTQLQNLSGENIKRLGSPFKVEASKRPELRRFIRHAPSRSDPFASGLLPHIRQMNQDSQLKDRRTIGALPYDPTEEGISDAERIRRQILNMPFTRQ